MTERRYEAVLTIDGERQKDPQTVVWNEWEGVDPKARVDLAIYLGDAEVPLTAFQGHPGWRMSDGIMEAVVAAARMNHRSAHGGGQ